MNLFAIIIYAIFLGPTLWKDLQTRAHPMLPIIINMVITLFTFQMNATAINQDIQTVFGESSNFFSNTIDSQKKPLFQIFTQLFNVLEFVVSMYMMYIIVLLVTRKQKGRKILIKILPILWVIDSISAILFYQNTNDIPNYSIFIPFVIITVGFILFITYIIYTRDFMKRIFTNV